MLMDLNGFVGEFKAAGSANQWAKRVLSAVGCVVRSCRRSLSDSFTPVAAIRHLLHLGVRTLIGSGFSGVSRP